MSNSEDGQDDILRNLFFEEEQNEERPRKRRAPKEKKPAPIQIPTDPIEEWRRRTEQWSAHLTSEKSTSVSEISSSYASDSEPSSYASSDYDEPDEEDENDPVKLMEDYERENAHIHEVNCPLCRYGAQGRGPSANHISKMRSIIIDGISQLELSSTAIANQVCMYYNFTAIPDIRRKLREEDKKIGRKRLREPIHWTLDSAIHHIENKVDDPILKIRENLKTLKIQEKLLILHCRPERKDPDTGVVTKFLDSSVNALLLRNLEAQRKYWTTKNKDLNARGEGMANEADISDPARLGVPSVTNTNMYEEFV
jgi:hypothetical protein